MVRTQKAPRVLLLVETSRAYGRGILEGIMRYSYDHGPWDTQFGEQGLAEPPPTWLKNWRGDGIITRTATTAMARAIAATRLPTVELLGQPSMGVAHVCCDNEIVGRMATTHFLDRGLRHFAFFTFGESWWIELRREAFVRALNTRGYSCYRYGPSSKRCYAQPKWSEAEIPRIAAWVHSLPRPVGVFCASDLHAVHLLHACRDLSIAVPEQLAILGVDNDPLVCGLTMPSLSSVDLNCRQIGYAAAALLDRRIKGHPPPKSVLRIPPSHVAVRQSTDILAIDNADLAKAVRFIRERACDGIGVADVIAEVGLSRRVLERRFHEHSNRTPKNEIMRVRIDRAKSLLAQSDLAIATISKKSGFTSFKYFAQAFRRETGIGPRAYRNARQVLACKE